jgi:hypothetical protein
LRCEARPTNGGWFPATMLPASSGRNRPTTDLQCRRREERRRADGNVKSTLQFSFPFLISKIFQPTRRSDWKAGSPGGERNKTTPPGALGTRIQAGIGALPGGS